MLKGGGLLTEDGRTDIIREGVVGENLPSVSFEYRSAMINRLECLCSHKKQWMITIPSQSAVICIIMHETCVTNQKLIF